jgi:hypothetical protein
MLAAKLAKNHRSERRRWFRIQPDSASRETAVCRYRLLTQTLRVFPSRGRFCVTVQRDNYVLSSRVYDLTQKCRRRDQKDTESIAEQERSARTDNRSCDKTRRKVAMKPKRKGLGVAIRHVVVVICTVALIPGDTFANTPPPLQTAQAPAAQNASATPG